MSTFLTLSKVKPDPESILLQLQLALQERGTWINLQTSGVGEALLELMSAVGGMNQFGLEAAFRETFITTALRASSIYAAARMLGVRVNRRYPASVRAQITRSVDTLPAATVARFTQFSIAGVDFFNRYPLMFAAGSNKMAERIFYGTPSAVVDASTLKFDVEQFSTSVVEDGDTFDLYVVSGAGAGSLKPVIYMAATQTFVSEDGSALGINEQSQVMVLNNSVSLYQGSITSETFVASGEKFSTIYLAEKNFKVSDVDVAVYVTSTTGLTSEWQLTSDGIWLSNASDKVYVDGTTGAGETVIMFGDGDHGAIPVLASTVTVKYAVTNGADGNNGLKGLEITCSTDSTLSGKTVSSITGGAETKDAEFYRLMAPMKRKANGRAVSPPDFLSASIDFPGVISASILTQREVAPMDLRWMNVIQICLLPIDDSADKLSAVEWSDFMKYIETRKHAAVHIAKKDPTPLYATVDLTLALRSSYTPSAVIPAAEAAVTKLFARRRDTLGRKFAVSDISDSARVEGVDYVDVNVCSLTNSGADNLVPSDKTQFIVLSKLKINVKYSERDVYYGDAQ